MLRNIFKISTISIILASSMYAGDVIAKDVVLNHDKSYAFVANDEDGLLIVDISDPTDPEKESEEDTDGHSYGVVLSNDEKYAFVADGENGLVVIDVSDPSSPDTKKVLNIDGNCTKVKLASDGNHLYLSNQKEGMVYLVNIKDPESAFIEKKYATKGQPEGLFVKDNLMYVSNGISGVSTLNIVNDFFPAKISDVELDNLTLSSKLRPDKKYIFAVSDDPADESSIFYAINIEDKVNPEIKGKYTKYDGDAFDTVISSDGKVAYMIGSDGVYSLDISDPSDIKKLDKQKDGYNIGAVLSSDDKYLYVANGKDGILIYDVSDPSDISKVSSLDLDGESRKVALSKDGKTLFVATNDNGLVSVDVSDPSNPTKLDTLDIGGKALNVILNGTGKMAYVAGAGAGLVIVDVSNPSDMKKVSSVDTSWAKSVSISYLERIVFVADNDNGVIVIDVGDKEHPKKIGNIDINAKAENIISKDGIGYVSASSEGLKIINTDYFKK